MIYKIFLLSVAVFILSAFATNAAPPDWFQPRATRARLQQSQTVSGEGIYTQPYDLVEISPALAAGTPASLELVFEKGTHVTETMFEVGAGGKLTFRDCRLNMVCIICRPGGEVRLENCALLQTYFPAVSTATGSGSPSSAPPLIVLKNCTVSGSSISSPAATGLTVKGCEFSNTELSAGRNDGLNISSSMSDSRFIKCKVLSGEVLMYTTRCWFQACECTANLDETFASYLEKPVLVQVGWVQGTPAVLPEKAGKVQFETSPYVKEAGVKEGGPTPAGTDKPGQLLAKVLNLADVTGTRITHASTVIVAPDGTLRYPPGQTPQAAKLAPPPTPANAVITGTSAAAGVSFKSRINQVNGLLISQLSSGGEAGQVTRMNLTALPSLGESPSTLKFNQDVGESMGKALNEVSKFSQLRHGGWPVGHSLEIGFEDKYIGKDGPSAAVACALLLEAAITGKKWDPAFAVTGDMNADGSVQPIGGVQAKIRGATKGSCKLMCVPVKNEKSVMDLLVLEGPAPLVGITVFGITTFDDALLLASTERPPALQSALTDFDSMRTVMMRDPRQMVPLLRTPHAAQRLQALLTAAPNCYSAKYLLLYLQGRGPRTLSIGGSIEAAQNNAQSVVSAIDHDVDANVSSLKGDELGNSLFRLRQVRPLLDARVWPYVDGLVAYGEVIRGALLNPVRSGARYTDLVSKANKAAGTVKAAYDKLINDPQVREELGL